MTEKEFVTFELRALGYNKSKAYEQTASLAIAAALVPEGSLLNAKTYTKAQAADVMFFALSAELQGEEEVKLLIDQLIYEKVANVTEETAIQVGVKQPMTAIIQAAAAIDASTLLAQFDKAMNAVASDYQLTDASGNKLPIVSAKWEENELGSNVVLLTTEGQKVGTMYTLHVRNISDTAYVMQGEKTKQFAGTEPIKYQEVVSATVLDDKNIEVTLKYEANETALESKHYAIDHDVTIQSIRFKQEDELLDGLNQTKVILTTSGMRPSILYKLQLRPTLQSAWGQGLKESLSFLFAGIDSDTQFNNLVLAQAQNKTTVKIKFGEALDRTTATQAIHYKISELGYPENVLLDESGTIITLTVSSQTIGRAYVITLNGLKDLAGNVVKADTKLSFFGKGEVVDRLKITGVQALSKN